MQLKLVFQIMGTLLAHMQPHDMPSDNHKSDHKKNLFIRSSSHLTLFQLGYHEKVCLPGSGCRQFYDNSSISHIAMNYQTRREIGDLLFTNVDNGVDRMVYHSSTIQGESFRDELEMLCYKNKMHVPENPGSLLFMVLGYLATLPHTDHFSKFGIRNLFVATDRRVVKILAQYGLRYNGRPLGKESYKAFVLHLDSMQYQQSFNKNDQDRLIELISREHPFFSREALNAALMKVKYISVYKPATVSQYNVLTHQGTKTFKASADSPLLVKVDEVSAIDIAMDWPHEFSKIRMPESSSRYSELFNKIPALYQDTITAHSLQSSSDNLLSFVQGALEFNYQRKNCLQIRSNYDFYGPMWKELLVLPMDDHKWGSEMQPLVVNTRNNDQQSDSELTDKFSLPSEYNTEAKNVEVVSFLLSDHGIIMQYRTVLPIAERLSIVDQLLDMVSTNDNDNRLKEDASSMIHGIEQDSAYFSRDSDPIGHKYFTNYMLGSLLGYSGGKDIQTYKFEYAKTDIFEDLVTFVLKERGSSNGVAFHIHERSGNSQKSTSADFLGKPRPDYTYLGITDRLLQMYFDFGFLPNERPVGRLSSFRVKGTFARYMDMMDSTSSSSAEGIFQKIAQQFQERNLYHMLTRNEEFSLILAQHASNIGLEVKTSSELGTLVNSFCLEKAGRNVFLPYTSEDPSILGVKRDHRFPIVLMKSELEKPHSQVMDDLRATYMNDYVKYPNKQNVFLKVNALTTREPANVISHGEYTNGIYGQFYEGCLANRRTRRDISGDFCRRKNHEDDPENQVLEEADENLNDMKPAQEKLKTVAMGRHRVVQHLETVGKVSSATMHFMMGKNILGALIDGDFKEVAINTGFLAGSVGLGYVSQYAALKGVRLAVDGSRILGSSLKLAAPFLARMTSAFVAFDLYKQVASYKAGNEDALVNILGDSSILAIDIAEVTIEVLESLELISSISTVTGPVGAAVGAVIFLATDIYSAVRRVDYINSVVKLTGFEKFKEGWLAFVHSSPESYIQDIMKNKQLNNVVANRSATVLNSLDAKIYATPTLSTCKPNLSSNFCLSGVMESENNIANFTNLRKFYSRSWPVPPQGYRSICAHARLVKHDVKNQDVEPWLRNSKPQVDDSRLSLECYSFEGILDMNVKPSEDAFINCGSGNDTISGFFYRKNIFSFTDGFKKLVGGSLPDTFILQGEKTSYGFINGGGGTDMIDFSGYVKRAASVTVYSGISLWAESANFLVVDDGHSTVRLQLDNMEGFIGREELPDKLMTTCFTKFVDLKGGSSLHLDQLQIFGTYNKQICDYRLLVLLSVNTFVRNSGCLGVFIFEIKEINKSGQIQIESQCGNESSAQTIIEINKTLDALNYINKTTVGSNTIIDLLLDDLISLRLVNLNLQHTILILKDFNMTFEPYGLVCEKRISGINDPTDIIKQIFQLKHIGASFLVEDEKKKWKISAGHSSMIRNKDKIDDSDSQNNANILSNDLRYKESILISSQGIQDVFHIKTSCNISRSGRLSCQRIVTKIYFDENNDTASNHTLDLSGIFMELEKYNSSLEISSQLAPSSTFYISLSVTQEQRKFFLGTIVLYNVHKEWVENRLTLVTDIPHHFQWLAQGGIELVPKPLKFADTISTIVLLPKDVTKNMSINIARNLGEYPLIAKSKQTNLIITNLLDPMLIKNQVALITLILADYFSVDNRRTFDSLNFHFNDRIFDLGETMNSEELDVLDWETCHDIINSLNKM